MKTLNISFDDEEFKKMERIKGKKRSWKTFILESCLKNKKLTMVNKK